MNKTNLSKVKNAFPLAIPLIGAGLSIAAKSDALITPEHRRTTVYILLWCVVLLISICLVVSERHCDRERQGKRHRLIVILSISAYFAMIVLSYLMDHKLVFISGIKTSPLICLLCIVTVISVVAEDIRAARLLLISVIAAEIVGGMEWDIPSWNHLIYSASIFRILLLSEMLIPIHILMMLPSAEKRRTHTTMDFLFCDDASNEICEEGVSLKNASIFQIAVSISAGCLMLCGGVHIMDCIILLQSIITVAVAEALLEADHYNSRLVAYVTIMKLTFDVFSNELLKNSDLYAIYIVFGIIALGASFLSRKRMFIFAYSAKAVVLITECIVMASTYISNKIAFPNELAVLYTAEILVLASILIFGLGGLWSESITDDLRLYLLISKDDE